MITMKLFMDRDAYCVSRSRGLSCGYPHLPHFFASGGGIRCDARGRHAVGFRGI